MRLIKKVWRSFQSWLAVQFMFAFNDCETVDWDIFWIYRWAQALGEFCTSFWKHACIMKFTRWICWVVIIMYRAYGYHALNCVFTNKTWLSWNNTIFCYSRWYRDIRRWMLQRRTILTHLLTMDLYCPASLLIKPSIYRTWRIIKFLLIGLTRYTFLRKK